MLAAAGSPRSMAAAASSIWRTSAARGVRSPSAAGCRCSCAVLVITGGQCDPGQQQVAAGGGQPAGQLGRGAQVAERQAQQRLLLIGLGQQRRAGPGQDQPRRLDRGQRLADLPAGGPDPGPVQQRQELEEGPSPLRYRQRSLGQLLRGIEVPPLQRQAGQHAQVIHGEEMPVESQPPGVGFGGRGRLRGIGQVAGLEPASAWAPGTSTSLAGSGSPGWRQRRGSLAFHRGEIVQAWVDAEEDQRDRRMPLVAELGLLAGCPGRVSAASPPGPAGRSGP